jgi:hypothetical protein
MATLSHLRVSQQCDAPRWTCLALMPHVQWSSSWKDSVLITAKDHIQTPLLLLFPDLRPWKQSRWQTRSTSKRILTKGKKQWKLIPPEWLDRLADRCTWGGSSPVHRYIARSPFIQFFTSRFSRRAHTRFEELIGIDKLQKQRLFASGMGFRVGISGSWKAASGLPGTTLVRSCRKSPNPQFVAKRKKRGEVRGRLGDRAVFRMQHTKRLKKWFRLGIRKRSL